MIAPLAAAALALIGPWSWPLEEHRVLAAFDPPAQRWEAGHRGVDLAAPPGTPVAAIGEGVVAFAGQVGGKAVVVVDHGSLRSTYEPLDASLPVGARVRRGEQLGSTSAGGHCSGRCLHLGVLKGEQYVDPMRLLEQRPILKPLRD
jgi:murein DD-endopeptidase MepM/ murein hydrolase activator NlpD